MIYSRYRNKSEAARPSIEWRRYPISPIGVHSGTSQLQRAGWRGALLKRPPHEPKALIGVKTLEKVRRIVIKSKYRKTFAADAYASVHAFAMGRKPSPGPLPGTLSVGGDMRLVQSRGRSVPHKIPQLNQPTDKGGDGEAGLRPGKEIRAPPIRLSARSYGGGSKLRTYLRDYKEVGRLGSLVI